MNWFITVLQKEAKHRRYRTDDNIRYFTKGRRGKVVLTPHFHRGKIKDFNSQTKRYTVQHEDGTKADVHPRNIVPDSISRSSPSSVEPISVEPTTVETSIA